nr:MAG TPA: hypothetical protein [Caudoviricetes sp.]
MCGGAPSNTPNTPLEGNQRGHQEGRQASRVLVHRGARSVRASAYSAPVEAHAPHLRA